MPLQASKWPLPAVAMGGLLPLPTSGHSKPSESVLIGVYNLQTLGWYWDSARGICTDRQAAASGSHPRGVSARQPAADGHPSLPPPTATSGGYSPEIFPPFWGKAVRSFREVWSLHTREYPALERSS